MMYRPASFKPNEVQSQIELMRQYPFAMVVTRAKETLSINHYPLLIEERGDEVYLVGHLARANPQSRELEEGEVTVIFQGPNTYVTPQWYPDPMNVPTWNYAVVHAVGTAKLVQDAVGIESILKKTVQEFERHEPKPWSYALPQEFVAGMLRAIVGFEIRVTGLEGKFKLSQNRDPDDRQGVLRGLATRKDENSLKILELMHKNG